MSATTSPGGEDKPIPNYVIRLVLETLRASSANAPQLIHDAGLDRLNSADLSDGAPPVVKGSELARVYGTVYQRIGEQLTRLFLSSYGLKMGPLLVQHPLVQASASSLKTLPEPQRLASAARETVKFLNVVWANVSLREDAEAFYFETAHCPICIHIRGAQAPMCASSELVYGAIVRAISGRWPTVTEVACRAKGDLLCSYRLKKA